MESRREFLKRMATTVVAMGLNPYLSVSVTDDIYTNSRLGLSLDKPRTWEYSSIADFAALREATVLQDMVANEPHLLKDPQNLPVFLFEDPTNREGYFAPGVVLFDEINPLPIPKDEALAHRTVMIDGFRSSYKNVELHEEPRQIELRGERGSIGKWSYTHEVDNGFECDVIVQSIVVFRGDRVHTFYLTDSLDAPRIEREIWDNVIQSITYN